MNLIEYPDSDLMMMSLADRLAGELRNCVALHDHASFAVPGGTTPGPVFDTLAAVDLDWPRIHVLLTDERWVPESSERSNTRLIRERLLVERAARAVYIPLYAEAPEPEHVIDHLAEAVSAELPLSVLLLGMGADMHVASLFPGADRLDAAMADNAPPLVAMRAPGAPEPRITLSARVLRGAMNTHILITGAEKRAALEKARRMAPKDAPVAAVLGNATVHWAE